MTGSEPGTGSVPIDVSAADHVAEPAYRALYVFGAGNVKFTCVDGTTDTYPVPDNFRIDLYITKVWAAPDTTATGIHGVR